MGSNYQIATSSSASRLKSLLSAFLTLLMWTGSAAAKTGKVTGTIFTLASGQTETVWPNARITLKNLATLVEFTTVSNDLGSYSFVGVLAGEYEITVTLTPFEAARKQFTLVDGTVRVDFQLTPKQ